MKPLTITSTESLDSTIADIVRLKVTHTAAVANKEAELVAVEKRHQSRITDLADQIAALEGRVQQYCTAHRSELFPDRKSRETSLAVFGFELTPYRVETTSKKIRWKDVVARLLRLAWGKAYVRQPEPQTDKQALLADREQLTPEQQTAAGIQFVQDEQFFVRPKPDTAENTARKAA